MKKLLFWMVLIVGIIAVIWACKKSDDSTFEKVCSLANEGLEQHEIVKDLEIHKSTVSRHYNKGKKEGLIRIQTN